MFHRWLVAAALLAPATARADWFVVTGADADQHAAQARAATTGGWVLDTDVYPGLSPGWYATVRGPFRSQKDAERALGQVRRWLPDAYAKDAGAPLVPMLGGNLDGPVVAALLGELSVDVSRHPGARNPCEPQEPYRELTLTWAGIEPGVDPSTGARVMNPKRQVVPFGGFWVIESTGAIERMRVCLE